MRIAHQKIPDNRHRNHAYRRSFKSGCIRQVIFLSKVCPVAKVLHRFNHSNDLASSANTFFKDFNLAF